MWNFRILLWSSYFYKVSPKLEVTCIYTLLTDIMIIYIQGAIVDEKNYD